MGHGLWVLMLPYLYFKDERQSSGIARVPQEAGGLWQVLQFRRERTCGAARPRQAD